MIQPVLSILKKLSHNSDGTFSSTKMWQSIGYTVATWIVIYLTMNQQMSVEYFLSYIAVIQGGRSFQNYLESKVPKSRENSEEI